MALVLSMYHHIDKMVRVIQPQGIHNRQTRFCKIRRNSVRLETIIIHLLIEELGQIKQIVIRHLVYLTEVLKIRLYSNHLTTTFDLEIKRITLLASAATPATIQKQALTDFILQVDT